MGLFGKEKITMVLDKYDYAPGEKISGKINLNLKKPVHARKLAVRLYAIRKDVSTGGVTRAMGGKSGTSYHRNKIYDFKQPLDGEKDYQNEKYSFEMKIPADVLRNAGSNKGELGEKAQAIIGAASMLAGHSRRLDWYVVSYLDVPAKLDIKKKQQIVISD